MAGVVRHGTPALTKPAIAAAGGELGAAFGARDGANSSLAMMPA
jgi:hypothetical protein